MLSADNGRDQWVKKSMMKLITLCKQINGKHICKEHINMATELQEE